MKKGLISLASCFILDITSSYIDLRVTFSTIKASSFFAHGLLFVIDSIELIF